MRYKGITWAGLYVENMEQALVFYRDILGLPVLWQDEREIHLDASNGAMLELFRGGKASSATKTPEQQSARIGFGVDDLESSIEELKSKGVNFIGEIRRFESDRWIYFVDPEGNQLELNQYRE